MHEATPGQRLQTLLGCASPPIAIAFVDQPPPGVDRIAEARPAGCGYWRAAAEGKVFYTDESDHYGCPVGAHTHRVSLPMAVQTELQGLIGTMVALQYLAPEDVARIPQRAEPMKLAVYAPLDDCPIAPDVALLRVNVRQMMLLSEAAQSAGIAGDSATMGRPTCAVPPQAINSGKVSSSFGCIGNRVYTGAADGEGYVALRRAVCRRYSSDSQSS